MGMSMLIFGVRNSENIVEETDLYEQIETGENDAVDLGKVFMDLAMVLTNDVDPFSQIESIGFKSVLGISGIGEFEVGSYNVVGYLNHLQLQEVTNWLLSLSIDSLEDFEQFYDELDDDVKTTLEGFCTDAEQIYEGYFEPLLSFYQKLIEEEKAALFCLSM
jgi:hypothetical protein